MVLSFMRAVPHRARGVLPPVQQHAASSVTQCRAELPRIKDELAAFLERGIVARGFLRLRRAPRMSQTGAPPKNNY
jgi:hypothetical protein